MNTKSILLTGGRAPVALEITRFFAKEAKHKVFVADSCSQGITRYSRYVEKYFSVPSPKFSSSLYVQKLLELCDKYKISLVIPTCEEVFFLSFFKKDFEDKGIDVFVDNIKNLKALHHKFSFNQIIQNTPLPGPSTQLITSFEQIKKRDPQKKQILKPAFSRFAATLHVLEKGQSLQKNDIECSIEKPWVLQDFIEGEEFCFYGIAHQGELVEAVCYKNNFKVKNGAGICFTETKQNEITDWAKKFVNQLDFHGQISFDIIKNAEGNFFPIECNPRATSGVHLLVKNKGLSALLNKKALKQNSTTQNSAQIRLAMLFFAFPSFKNFSSWLSYFFRTRDVLVSSTDIGPLFGQLMYTFEVLLISLKKKLSLIEATTYDIQWDGENIK